LRTAGYLSMSALMTAAAMSSGRVLRSGSFICLADRRAQAIDYHGLVHRWKW
jgi:hypothetical protein